MCGTALNSYPAQAGSTNAYASPHAKQAIGGQAHSQPQSVNPQQSYGYNPQVNPGMTGAYQTQQGYANQGQAQAQAKAFPRYSQGCLGAAWSDITGRQGWFKKTLLLALVMFVPILNFFVIGYALKKGADAAYGRQSQKDQIFDSGNFKIGFFAVVITLVCLLIVFLVGLIPVPIIGSLVAILLGIVQGASYIRIAVFDSLAQGFQIPKLFSAMGKKFGTYIWCLIGIGLICFLWFLILALLSSIVGSIFAVSIADTIQDLYIDYLYYSYYSSYYGYGLSSLGGTLLAFVLIIIVFTYLAFIGISFLWCLLYRALGHWVARYVPEWISEANNYRVYTPSNYYALAQDPTPASTSGSAPVSTPGFTSNPSPSSVSTAGSIPTPSPVSTATPGSTAASMPFPTLSSDNPTGILIQSVRLVRNNGQTITVKSFPAVLGKGSAATYQIEGNNMISREHVKIFKINNSVQVQDMGSTNKTFVNGRELNVGETVELHRGDTLTLADEIFKVDF